MKFLIISMISVVYVLKVHAGQLKITKVQLNCGKGQECKELVENFNSLKRSYVNLDHLTSILKLYVLNEGIRNFNFHLDKLDKVKDAHQLTINLIPKKRVASVSVRVKGEDLGYPTILPIQRGDYIDEQKIKKTKRLLTDLYFNKGFPDVVVDHREKKQIEKGVGVEFIIRTNKPITVDNIQINSNSNYLKPILYRRLSAFFNKPFDIQEVKNVIEDVRLIFLHYGYYLAQTNFKYKVKGKKKADLYIDLQSGGLHQFHFLLDSSEEKDLKYKDILSGALISYQRELSKKMVIQLLSEQLKEEGYLYPEIDVTKKVYKNRQGDEVKNYKIKLKKGERSYVKKVEFRGNNAISVNMLKKIYYENAYEQAARNIYDEKYYTNFRELVRQEYIRRGYVNVFVDKPEIKIFPKTKNVNIVFRIREGVPSKVVDVQITGVPKDLQQLLLDNMDTKVTDSFNPIAFKNDLETLLNTLKNKGYYYCQITNYREDSIVTYSNDNSQVSINIKIHLDKKLQVSNIIIVGNRKTRSKFILRELFIKPKDIITPNAINNSQTSLLSSGLFSSVNITPVKNMTNNADILISLKEKDFGLIEIAPGIRTDLGPKFSTSVTYNNLDGMGKKITFNGQVNQRFNLNTLDPRRRVESNSLLEYSTLVNFSENHIFDTEVDFSTSLSKSRRRFYSFDADIQKGSLTGSWDATKWLNFSVTYQLETISQYDSTLDREHGHFQIGSMTPGLILDFRDNRINPTQGAYFNLSCEFANPNFLSQSTDELEVNYYKLISRNRFYLKIPNGVLALSLSAGYQKNLATDHVPDGLGGTRTKGYIPNIKVFRLSGMDIVRGFEDDEINRLVTNQDISEVRVDQRAYMSNLKLEPRFFLSDSMMLGVFYDAGRVFVDSYDLDQLRSSAGISFKYLTPVGSLDFDYGIKLLRKRDDDGKLESPGRLHVSIGFF